MIQSRNLTSHTYNEEDRSNNLLRDRRQLLRRVRCLP
jgi:hypothetical protein